MRKNINTKQRQFEMLVDFFKEHNDLAKGQLKTPAARACATNLWIRLTGDLNAAGPPSRDVSGWKKVWADYKNHIKAKLRKNKVGISGTGGGPSKFCPLSPLEEEVSQLLSIDKAVNGMDGTMNFGILEDSGNEGNLNVISELDSSESTSASTSAITFSEASTTRTPSRRHFICGRNGKENLLEKQVQNQIKYHENSIKILENMSLNIQNLCRYSRKNYELEDKKYKLAEKKYKLAKERFEYKKRKDIEKRNK